MNVIGFVGASGVGKTTLVEGVLAALRERGLRVSVVKHARHGFDLDTPGKDSFRMRQAGAFEVVVASGQRLAKLREFEAPVVLSVHQLLAELVDVDWALYEGFKHADVHKIEVWRAAMDTPAIYPDDPYVVGVATDQPAGLPVATQRPVFELNQAQVLAQWLLDQGSRFAYQEPSSNG